MPGVVANGGFESYGGKSTAESMTISPGSGELTGWTVQGVVKRIKGDKSTWGAPGAVDGSWIAGLHAREQEGSLTTTLRALKPGSSYLLRWSERDRKGFASKTVRVSVDGQVVYAEHVVPDAWTKREVYFTPEHTTAVLEFYDKGQDADGTAFLDAVTVTLAGQGHGYSYYYNTCYS